MIKTHSGGEKTMKSKEIVNTALFAVALAMAASSFALMILENITGESYIPTVIIFLAIGLFVVAVVGISSVSKD